MKLKLFFVIILLFLMSSLTKAQLTAHTLVHVGYVYQNQSFGEIGGRLLLLNNDDVIFRIGASGLFGSVNGKFAAMPKVQADVLFNFEKNVDLNHAYYFLGGAEITTQYIAPKVGVTLFGLVDLTGGYAFPLGTEGWHGKKLEGFNLNFTINLPIVMIRDLLE